MSATNGTFVARRAYGLACIDGRAQLAVTLDGETRVVDGAPPDSVAAAMEDLAPRRLGRAVAQHELVAPVAPSKVIGVGLNYRRHAAEASLALPELPQLFAKFPSAIAPPESEVELATPETDYEVELGIVIGRQCRDVEISKALNVVAGYVAVNDISARDRQFADGQYVLSKSYDGYAPCGPAIVPVSELDDAHNLRLRTLLNDKPVQDSSTADMVFGVREIVAYCSIAVTLLPGDLILTGTPEGVGFTRNPPRHLREGDVVKVAVEGVGTCLTRCSGRRLQGTRERIESSRRIEREPVRA